MKKKILSLFMTLVMVVGLVGVMPVVSAEIIASAAYENTYKNTGNQRVDIVGVAKTQIGNTKGSKYGSGSWCAHFVIWCARQANISSKVIATTGWACASDMKVKYYDKGSYTPKSGDLVYFNWPSTKATWDHVGIVEKVGSDGSITTIEGNRDNGSGVFAVRRCTYTKNGYSQYSRISSIRGYGVPNYSDSSIHVHKYTRYFESAHPHRVYMKCSCGKFYYTGETTISTNCSTCMKKSTKYPTPIKAYTLGTGKTTVYSSINGKAKTNKIYDTDLCTITKIYENGWCKVTFPLTSGKTDSGYVKTSVFFNHSYNVTTSKISKKVTTYARSNLSKSIGYAGSGDRVYIIGHTSKAVQIVYPLTAGGYKAGWVPISAFTYTFKYNANGGNGSMSNTSGKYQNAFKLSKNTFKRNGYTFVGWNVYRSSDKKWYVSGKGWFSASEIKNKKYTKKLYANASKYNLNQTWINGSKTNDTYTFYAVWKKK